MAPLPLREAATLVYLDPTRFMTAFAADPAAAILGLVADPSAYGARRTIFGPIGNTRQLENLLAAARSAYGKRGFGSPFGAK